LNKGRGLQRKNRTKQHSSLLLLASRGYDNMHHNAGVCSTRKQHASLFFLAPLYSKRGIPRVFAPFNSAVHIRPVDGVITSPEKSRGCEGESTNFIMHSTSIGFCNAASTVMLPLFFFFLFDGTQTTDMNLEQPRCLAF
jgi:hypothetical protein